MQQPKKKRIRILFVCRHNKFRSRFAELYFKKINKNKNIEAKSAGIFPGGWPLEKEEIKVSKKLGIKLRGKPKAITTKLLKWKDIIILITDDIKDPENLFNYGDHKSKIIHWKIKDNYSKLEENIELILRSIITKINKLNKKLNKTSNS